MPRQMRRPGPDLEDHSQALTPTPCAAPAARPTDPGTFATTDRTQEAPGCKTVHAFMPDHPDEGVGTLARVRTEEGPEGDVVFERSAERPMDLWADAGEGLRRIVPLLGPDAPPADELDDCRLCHGCYRPVYESSSSHTLIGAGPLPVIPTYPSTRSSAPCWRPWPLPWRSWCSPPSAIRSPTNRARIFCCGRAARDSTTAAAVVDRE